MDMVRRTDMVNAELSVMVNSLKAQFNVLEAKIKEAQKPSSAKKFADFYGAFSQFGETSEEEINAVKFKFKEEAL